MKFFSAKKTLNTKQKIGSVLVLIVLSAGLYISRNYLTFLVLLIFNIIFLFGSLFRLFLIASHKSHNSKPSQSPKIYPKYSVLVPLYKEVGILPHLIKSLSNIKYDKDKLEILLALEEDDIATIKLAEESNLPKTFKIIIVPNSYPKTKPKACNHALKFASGEYITIYDAEDRPDPEQLIKALSAFANLPDEYVCVQSKLAYYNAPKNFLTSCFELEYFIHFNLLLESAASLGMPIPLGGTSNHFKTSFLKENPWDSYNVTEDAEFGFRIHLLGKKVAFINSTTLEQAPRKLNSWLNQRSRWIKGYMQTYLSFSRYGTKKLRSKFGTAGYVFFIYSMLVVPFSLAFMPLLILLGLMCFTDFINFDNSYDFIIVGLGSINLLTNQLSLILSAKLADDLNQNHKSRYWLLFGIYQILQIPAAIKAIISLIKNPHYWAKTEHEVVIEQN